jgi:hypothetical protein
MWYQDRPFLFHTKTREWRNNKKEQKSSTNIRQQKYRTKTTIPRQGVVVASRSIFIVAHKTRLSLEKQKVLLKRPSPHSEGDILRLQL